MPESNRLNPDGLIVSDHYQDTMERLVLPYLDARREDITVRGAGDRPLFCSRFTADHPRGTVVVVHGFTENAFKYSEIIHSLLRNGYCVCAYDQRGHGRSWRAEGIDDLSLTHVDDFDEYVEDLRCVLNQAVADLPRPLMTFAHSMGGAVVSLLLEHEPEAFSKAALCSPMIAPNRGGIPMAVGLALCRGARLLGQGKQRIFMSKPFDGPEDFETSCATGRERFDWYNAAKTTHPEFQNNGPTYSWLLQALLVTKKLLRKGAVEGIQAEVSIYAAENENTVVPEAQETFASRLSHGKRQLIPGSKHEIFFSPDDVVFPWWRQVLAFLEDDG